MKKIGIIGLGAIGGSIAAAVKKQQACDQVFGCDINVSSLKQAYERNLR